MRNGPYFSKKGKVVNYDGYVYHTIFGDENHEILLKIIKDGCLLPSSKTGITRLCGEEKSDFIYLTFKTEDSGCGLNELVISPEVLRGRSFYLNEGWKFVRSSSKF